MHLSIITPHYNDLEGLKRIHDCLKNQSSSDWEWIIVDDYSDILILEDVENWHKKNWDNQIQFIRNSKKTNASVCRNVGANLAQYNHLVFLDADDYITHDFVANRQVVFTDFAVFKNTAVDDKYRGVKLLSKKEGEAYLNFFLKAQFIWPITSILWERQFFNILGGFNEELSRLQDIELTIRALQKSKEYYVLDNSIDFYYRVKPIHERKNFVKPVCESVYLFINKLLDTKSLTKYQLSLISSYYYLCVKYLVRLKGYEGIAFLQQNLKLFYKKRHISIVDYVFGFVVLKLYEKKVISKDLFMRVNRSMFKPK